jgi:hypothetical protein
LARFFDHDFARGKSAIVRAELYQMMQWALVELSGLGYGPTGVWSARKELLMSLPSAGKD